ncbi:Peptide chain release factor PrfB2, chloroplastic-like protein [Drosera capensis]
MVFSSTIQSLLIWVVDFGVGATKMRFWDPGIVISSGVRLFGSNSATESSTSDGLTVERILGNQWAILDENGSDWKSHVSAIARSIHLIKKRLQWKKLMVKLDQLSAELDKPHIWDDPVHTGKISHEHGSLMGKVKEVKAFEQELYEHIDMVKLARDEGDAVLESVRSRF